MNCEPDIHKANGMSTRPTHEPDHWMDTREASAYLNLGGAKSGHKRMSELAKSGRIPAHKIPGMVGWRFRKSELDACLVPNGYNASTCSGDSQNGEL